MQTVLEKRIEKNLSSNYLVIDLPPGETEDYRIRMCSHNRINGLLRTSVREADGTKSICYDISSKVPLSVILKRSAVRADMIMCFIVSIKKLLDSIEAYLITPYDIVLDPDYIFADDETMEAVFCVLPGQETDFAGDLREILKKIMEAADMSDMNSVMLAYSVYHASMKENYVISDILDAAAEAGQKNSGYSGTGIEENCMAGESDIGHSCDYNFGTEQDTEASADINCRDAAGKDKKRRKKFFIFGQS